MFKKADVTKPEELRAVFEKHNSDTMIHLAAESPAGNSEKLIKYVNIGWGIISVTPRSQQTE